METQTECSPSWPTVITTTDFTLKLLTWNSSSVSTLSNFKTHVLNLSKQLNNGQVLSMATCRLENKSGEVWLLLLQRLKISPQSNRIWFPNCKILSKICVLFTKKMLKKPLNNWFNTLLKKTDFFTSKKSKKVKLLFLEIC